MKNYIIKLYNVITFCHNVIINDVYFKYLKRKPNIRSVECTVEKIINEKNSICRFGDGEIALIQGEDLKFQEYTIDLSRELREIIISDDSKLLICLPDVFGDLTKYTDTALKYWKKYLHYKRYIFYKYMNLKKVYYNANISRFYIDYRDKSCIDEKVTLLKKIWDDKKILIIEGEKSRLGVGNDLFNNSNCIRRFICPSINAYKYIDNIYEKILTVSKNYDLILIALGPTATCLAYRLNKMGIQALDIGHIDIEYEWYLSKCEKKTIVKNKYIGEIPGGDLVDSIYDDIYDSQIIERIGV